MSDRSYEYTTTKSSPTWASDGIIYGPGGYVKNFGLYIKKARRSLNELRNSNWTGALTRALIIDTVLYNANVNLFAAVKVVIALSPSGHFESMSQVNAVHLYPYIGGQAVVQLCLQIIWVLLVLYLTFKEIKKLKKLKLAYFAHMWNILTIASLSFAYTAVIMYAIQIIRTQQTIEDVKNNLGGCMHVTNP